MDLRGDFAVVIVAVADQDYRALRPREARDLAAALNDMAERCEK